MAPPTKKTLTVPAGASQTGDGIAVGSGSVTVEAYIDFLCPFCKRFEDRNGPALHTMIQERAITLVYHPLGFLDRLSTTRYSTRAASASGCASDAGRFAEYKDALFANQPPEGGPGLTDAQLVELGTIAGIRDQGFAECVAAHRYAEWVALVTASAIDRGVQGTPTVFVDGIQVPPDARAIAAAVAAVAARPG
jgi:protein-disulfide isomerase